MDGNNAGEYPEPGIPSHMKRNADANQELIDKPEGMGYHEPFSSENHERRF
jgi:hypothetical protein